MKFVKLLSFNAIMCALVQIACTDDVPEWNDLENSESVNSSIGTFDYEETQPVGDMMSEISVLTIDASIDSFTSDDSEFWKLDVVKATLTYSRSNGRTKEAFLTSSQTEEIVAMVKKFSWRNQSYCLKMLVDGGALPPIITIRQPGTDFVLSVSDADCAFTDQSITGPVIGCDDYGKLRKLIEAHLRGSGAPNLCSERW